MVKDKKHALLQEDEASQNCVDWREAFKRAYIGMPIHFARNTC